MGDILVLVLNMSAKNCEKIQPLGHIFGLALPKKFRFCTVWSKKNRDFVLMLQNFSDTPIKIHINYVQSSVAFQISLDFFLIFSTETCKVIIDEPNLSANESAVFNCR